MLCHDVNSSDLFSGVAIVTLTPYGTCESVKPFFPADFAIDDKLEESLRMAGSLMASPRAPHVNNEFYIYTCEDSTFIYVLRRKEGDSAYALCVISKYLHIRIFEFLLKKAVENLSKAKLLFPYFRNIKFVADKYDVYIQPAAEWECPISNGLSPIGEIGYHHEYLLKRFPPYFLGTIIAYLFTDMPVVVISSSLEDLSHTVLSLSHLLYPLQVDKFKVPITTIVGKDVVSKLTTAGPCILGCHSSMSGELARFNGIVLNTDVPYITPLHVPTMTPRMVDLISQFNDNIASYVEQYRPVFPSHSIYRAQSKLVIDLFGSAFSCESDDFDEFMKQYNAANAAGFTKREDMEKKMLRSTLSAVLLDAMMAKDDKYVSMVKKGYFPAKFEPNYVPQVPQVPRRKNK